MSATRAAFRTPYIFLASSFDGAHMGLAMKTIPAFDDDFQRSFLLEQRESMRAGRAFEAACRADDLDLYRDAVETIGSTTDGWRFAMLRASRLPHVSEQIHKAFLNTWVEHKGLPRAVGHRPTMAAALRVLFGGRYRGEALQLYRGAGEHEHKRKIHGFSWSRSLEIATKFAEQNSAGHRFGAVTFSTLAPAAAILLSREADGFFDEGEVIVDPYALEKVTVVRHIKKA